MAVAVAQGSMPCLIQPDGSARHTLPLVPDASGNNAALRYSSKKGEAKKECGDDSLHFLSSRLKVQNYEVGIV
jgi:hypothetical protein